ncbi:MAG TPA: cation:proton antiporter [Minicystis sp.]|nr:cation:proton antiporter [Minicystis sp.]
MKAALHPGPLILFLAQAMAIIVLSRLVGLATRRLRQPMVVAEIVAGVALGPSLFGFVAPGAAHALFPPESLGLLHLASQIGLVLFMFLVGLEFDTRLLKGRGHTSVVISHTSIIVPFALGALLALALYPRLSDPSVPFSSFTLFMGVAMSITAFPVLARILVERRLLRSQIGAVTISCAAVDDVTAWCLLAFIVAIVRSAHPVTGLRTTALALGYVALMLFVVRPFFRRLAARSPSRDVVSQNLVALVLVLVLASSGITELIGIHALFGAFLFGAVIPKENAFAHVLTEKLEDLVIVFLLPLFFAYSGLRTQIGLLDSPSTWLMCAAVIGVACAGKFGGTAIAARLTGLGWREASAVGVLMNTRGLMELIILNIGLDLGVISPRLFTMMVLMALVTTFLTTPLLERIYPQRELERELLAAAEKDRPAAPAAGGFVVVMCVASERSGPAMVTLGSALVAKEADRARLYALRLLPPADRASALFDQREEEPAEAPGLAPLLERAKGLAQDVRPLSFVSADAARDICSVAEVKRAGLVVLGWHRPVLGKAALGGTVHDVMKRAQADVGVLVDRGLESVRRVLVPYLGSDHDRAALRLSRRLAENAGAEITILHVVRSNRRIGVEARIDEVFHEPEAGGARVHFKTVPSDDPGGAALEESRAGYDLVVIGVGPEWGLEHRPFGRKAELLIQQCPTSLLVVRQRPPVADPAAESAVERAPGGARPAIASAPEA